MNILIIGVISLGGASGFMLHALSRSRGRSRVQITTDGKGVTISNCKGSVVNIGGTMENVTVDGKRWW